MFAILFAAIALLAVTHAQETCVLVDPSGFLVQCETSGYFCFDSMGSGYAAEPYAPPGQQTPWVFFFQMIGGALPATVTEASTGDSCKSIPKDTTMVQYANGACYNLAALNPAPVISYHSETGDGSYMDIRFLGGDGGRSAEITYYCNQQGSGIQTFQYDYESPSLNYQASMQGPQVCTGSPTKLSCGGSPPPPPPSPPQPQPTTCKSAQPDGTMPAIPPKFSAEFVQTSAADPSLPSQGTLWADLQSNLARTNATTQLNAHAIEIVDTLQVHPGASTGAVVYTTTYNSSSSPVCVDSDGSQVQNFAQVWNISAGFSCMETTTFKGVDCDVWVSSTKGFKEIWWCGANNFYYPARTLQVVNNFAVLTELLSFTPALPAFPDVFALNPACK